MSPRDLARLCHEVNKAYCLALGDDSQLNWDQAPEWQQKSAIEGVSYHLHHSDATPEMSHHNWLVDKQKDGWSYGPVKNPIAKQHPCMVPYNDLPPEQRAKDWIFKGIIEACRPMVESDDLKARRIVELERVLKLKSEELNKLGGILDRIEQIIKE